jgi:hypothetical protein
MMHRRHYDPTSIEQIARQTIQKLARGEVVPYHGRYAGPIARAHQNLWKKGLVQIQAADRSIVMVLSESGKKLAQEL